MSLPVDADTKERVRAATDIVELIGGFVELRRQGRGFVALCPFHRDRRPSLQVNPERQIWKCWVCDIGGDVFNFVMQHLGLSFPDALKMLAERAGIALEASSSANKSGAGKSGISGAEERSTLFRLMAWASRLYHQFLLRDSLGQSARDYLAERGITADSIAKFEIGLAPDSWSFLIDQSGSAGYSSRQLEAAGLIARGERGHAYDRFRGRLMFPIRDAQKRVIAFGGRVLPGSTEGAKYINSPETKIFTKNQNLYGLDLARDGIREHRQAIVMEGYTDVIVAHQCGLASAVAVLGTALGANHLKVLRHLCDQVILVLDGDEAGQRRSDEVLELFLNAQMDVRVLTLPQQLDPADFLLSQGSDAFRELVSRAPDALNFKMRRVCEGFDPLLETHRANAAVEELLALLAKVPRSNLVSDDAFLLRRNQVLASLAKRFMVPEDELRQRLRGLMARAAKVREPKLRTALGATAGDATRSPRASIKLEVADGSQARLDSSHTSTDRLLRPGDLTPIERELLELVITTPHIAPLVLERAVPEWIVSAAARQMLQTYYDLELLGQDLDFDSVMLSLEDASLKSLMVTLYEQAQVKQQFTKDSPEQRLRVLTQRMGQQQEEMQRRHQLSLLEQGGLDDDAELSLLSEFIRQARQSHGLDDEVEGQSSDA